MDETAEDPFHRVRELATLHRRYLELTDELVRPLKVLGLTRVRVRMIEAIGRCGDGAPIAAVVRLTAMKRSHVSHALRDMEAHGIVQAGVDIEDRRYRIYLLTPLGHTALNAIHRADLHRAQRLALSWGPHRAPDLIDHLKAIVRILEHGY